MQDSLAFFKTDDAPAALDDGSPAPRALAAPEA
jgi:hypothetical protein